MAAPTAGCGGGTQVTPGRGGDTQAITAWRGPWRGHPGDRGARRISLEAPDVTEQRGATARPRG